jgi:hypothetical protein|tara:strand:+ start:199 stop:1071 length:873 start_codon:yes stop_codon:yes gene_type:complete
MGTFDHLGPAENPKMLAINGEDEIMKHWIRGTSALVIDRKDICSKVNESPWRNDIPVAFRSMTKRKEIYKCWETGRPFYYIDNGYMGNLMKKKHFYRVVKNNIQHTKYKTIAGDRFQELLNISPYMKYFGRKDRSKQNGPILLVTPSEKPCAFYNITKAEWLKDTIAELRKHTNRKIIIREKGLRPDRIKDNSVAHQCFNENVYAVVTYQSMAALEAMHYGIPAFVMAPCCVTPLANTELSKIEDAFYPEKEQMMDLLHYLAYCQFTPEEMSTSKALKLIDRNGLYDEAI